jgi:RNA polymerase sigma-70 factor (ECF subfamily)
MHSITRITRITRINETIRLAADGLEAVSTGGFGRRTGGDTCEELVRRATDRARAGDEGALRFLYLRYSPAVFSYVRAMLGDEHAAEDVTQIVFARLAMRLQRYRSGEAPFGTWIARVAHNAAIDHVRAQRLVPCEELHDAGAAHENESPERLDTLRQALKTLPQDQREVVVLRLVIGMSASEVGERIGRSEPAVHALQHKGRRQLRNELIRLDAGPTVRAAA